MYETFAKNYAADDFPVESYDASRPDIGDLINKFGGNSFSGGLYRIHSSEAFEKWTRIVEEAFPYYEGKIVCFGYDWLGRHFGLSTIIDDQIYLFEPGAGEVMDISVSLSDFHNIDLVEYPNDAVAADFYQEWRSIYSEPLGIYECVGYINPLFLGGSDEVSNLEKCDMEVYWGICAQLMAKIRG